MKHYNYIFTGSGLSALMTVYEIIMSGKFSAKSILLIDNNTKKTNDRTWCFWEKPNHQFKNLVSKKWNEALFANQEISINLDLKPYQYNMIKGLDFYNLVFDLIAKQENITFVTDSLISFNEEVNKVTIICEKQNYSCDKLFNSIFNPEIVRSQTNYPLLSQHFIGWFVQTKEEVFNPDRATFMDFSIDQKGNTRFMYVLPTSTTEALLEPTLFSHHLLKKEEYEADIELYLKNLGVSEYKINDKEQGNIPMTSYPFWKNNTKNIVNIGSAGGWTKASTGFTFRHTVKKSQALVAFLSKETSTPLSVTDFRKFHKKGKFWFYDLLFLDVLDKNNDLGSHVFSSLFKNGKTSLIFKFLDEETTYWEDLQIIFICPKSLFLKALFNRVFGC